MSGVNVTMRLVGRNELLRDLEQAPAKLAKAQRDAVNAIALMAKTTALGEAARDLGGDLTMGRMGAGVKVGARYTIRGTQNPTALVVPYPPGPWYLLEYGSPREYTIMSRGVGRAKGRSRRARLAARQEMYETLFGGHNPTGGFLGNPKAGFAAMSPVTHPAQRSHHTWSRAAAVSKRVAPRIWRAELARQVRRIFGGS